MYKNIIMPIDLNDQQSLSKVLPPALNFVNCFNANLNFIHVIPDFGLKMVEDFLPKSWSKTQIDKSLIQLRELVTPVLPVSVEANYYVERGAVYDQVINFATNNTMDLIIISAVRIQLQNYMLGPNASKIVRHADISVLVVR